MRLVRYQIENETPQYGWALVDSHETYIGPIEGTPFGEFRRLEANLPKDSVRLLAPVQPSKIICIGRNYIAHAREHDSKVPEVPLLFLKPPSSVIGPGLSLTYFIYQTMAL